MALVVVGSIWPALSSLWPTRWTSQSPTEFPAAVERYYRAVAAATEAAPVSSFVHCGHRAGSYQEFAKNLQLGQPLAPRSVVELMDRAFDERGLNAIEIDLRASPFNEREVVVVHDAVDGAALDDAGRRYVEENTARAVLRHFLAQGHHERGRRLVFELKAPLEGLDDEARAAIDRFAAALSEQLAGRPDEEVARRRIDVISFSFEALERLHQALGADAGGHGFMPIITTDRYPEWLVRLASQTPFSRAVKARLRELPWLTGVYFDPRFVKDFGALFNGINDDREANDLTALEMHVSTYSHELDELVARLRAQREPLRNVRGLIYQIRKD